jgi:hypothetical protein
MKMAGKVLVAIASVMAILFVSAPVFAQFGINPLSYGGYPGMGYGGYGKGLGYGTYGAYPGMQGLGVPAYGSANAQVPYGANYGGLGKGMGYGGYPGMGYGGIGGYGPAGFGFPGAGLGIGGFGGPGYGLGIGGFPALGSPGMAGCPCSSC